MRVLFNTKPSILYNKTGVGYYVLNLYNELLRSGIDIVPTVDKGSRTLLNSLSKISSRLRKIAGKRYPSFIPKVGDAMIKVLYKRSDPLPFDIYHETSLDPIPWTDAAIVCNIYDLSFIRCPQFLIKEFSGYAERNIRENVLKARRIIVNTEFIKNEVIDFLRIPEDRIDVIPLAPSTAYFMAKENKDGIAGVPKDRPYILYVGTVEPRKNLKTLIRAFREIRAENNIALIIAGGLGWLYDDIIQYPEDLGIKDDVYFTGYVDEMTLGKLYNHALLFVYPSLYEGFGLPLLEAMACGIPVIVSDIPPLREVSGDAALAFSPEDYTELASKIRMVISSESLRAEMVKRGLERVREYSWKKVADSTIKTYERALED